MFTPWVRVRNVDTFVILLKQNHLLIFMQAVLLCLLLNKLQLLSPTQHSFVLMQFVHFTGLLHVSACIRPSSGKIK